MDSLAGVAQWTPRNLSDVAEQSGADTKPAPEISED
jgi:hypothetical protein